MPSGPHLNPASSSSASARLTSNGYCGTLSSWKAASVEATWLIAGLPKPDQTMLAIAAVQPP
nr:hypothetical protein [Methylobacterium aquaticum]